jgi:hypothetical protein
MTTYAGFFITKKLLFTCLEIKKNGGKGGKILGEAVVFL